jgi:hypothetical protein
MALKIKEESDFQQNFMHLLSFFCQGILFIDSKEPLAEFLKEKGSRHSGQAKRGPESRNSK